MGSSSSIPRRNEPNALSVLDDDPGGCRKTEESVKAFDVFINHRGPDVKNTLALQLYESLEKLGIRAYLDSEEKELGISFPSSIKNAISSAKVHIAIFSRRYAESAWCLAELVLMMRTEANIIPVFYEVKPSELRYTEKGVYSRAFKKHKSRYPEKHEEWKNALRKIADIAGHEIEKSKCPLGFRRALPDSKDIVLAVQRQVQKVKGKLHVAKHPVGLPMLVKDFEKRCSIDERGQGKVRVVGICGMGGAGKTTLSKELFNRYSGYYTRASFLSDVREASNRDALYSLQVQLFKDLFDDNPPDFTNTSIGIQCLQNRLERIKYISFLIVLDDIDRLDQLENLLFTDMKNKPGDILIIITTRDAGVLRSAEIPTTYPLNGLGEDDAGRLFCFHAFNQSTPHREYDSLVDQFVEACGRLPLSLQILGSHVKGTDLEFWVSALDKVRKTLHEDIKGKLRISIDSLDLDARELFLDIACFFIGYSKNLVKRIGKASGWEADHDLEILKEKFIIQEVESEGLDRHKWEWDGINLAMHDHLRDLGRDMARELANQRKSSPRLRQPLRSMESQGEFSIIINKNKGRCFHSFSDTSMGSQITYFSAESDDFGERSASLLWLQLDLKSGEHPSIPPWIPLQNLQCLRVRKGCLTRLWDNQCQAPLQLKELQISETNLEEVPNLEELHNLENVILDAEYMTKKDWSLLESLRMNIINLSLLSVTLEGKLAWTRGKEWLTHNNLIIRNFKLSEEMVLNGSPLTSVESLEIGNQDLVAKISISENHWPRLQSLKLHHVKNLIEVYLLTVKTLKSFEVSHCENLKRVSGISDLMELEELNISECPELESELRLHRLSCLERVTVDRCRKLKCFELIDCKKVVELSISECPELERDLCLRSMHRLRRISVDRCRKLKCLVLIDCKILETVSGMEGLEELGILKIKDCPELRQLPAHNFSCWKRITIDGCEELNCQGFYSLFNFKIVTFDIGRAAEGAQSTIQQYLYSEAPIGAEAVSKIDDPCQTINQALVSKVIICALVVVDTSTPSQFFNGSKEFHLRKGRWIVTMVIADPKRDTSLLSAAVEGMCHGLVENGFKVSLMKHQEGQTVNVLETIDNRLYKK